MTKDEAAKLLQQSRISEWNAYRQQNPGWVPDLTGLDLYQARLVAADKAFNLSGALLMGTKFSPNTGVLLYNPTPKTRRPNLTGALVDVDTHFPYDFDPIAHGCRVVSKSEAAGVTTIVPSAFISYTWADEDIVLAIDQWLRFKRVQVRIDRRDFFAGSKIRDEIGRVMKESTVVVVMYTERAKDKPWPQFERELAADMEMEAKIEGRQPPRIVYVALDDTPLPSVTERARIAIIARGKRFDLVCEEIYHAILRLPKEGATVDLERWKDYVF